MSPQTAVEDRAAIKAVEDAVTGHKQPLSATDIEIAIGYRLPEWSMELLLRLLQQRDEEVTTENERLRGIVPDALERLNDELCEENEALRRERDKNLDSINLCNSIITRLHGQRKTLLEALRPFAAINASVGFTHRDIERARAVMKAAAEEAAHPIERVNALSDDEVRDVLEAEFLGEISDTKRSWSDDLRVFRAAERAHHITRTEAQSAPEAKERVVSRGLSPEVRPVLAHSRQALLSVLGCYPLEHDKRPGAAQARSALQQIDRLMNESVERNPIAPALTPEPVSVRLTLRTAEGREGQETLGSGTPLSWDRDGDDETVTAFFELLQKTKDGHNVVCGGHEIDGDAWRELESQGDPELVLLAVRNDVPLVQAVTAALEAARRSQQQPRER